MLSATDHSHPPNEAETTTCKTINQMKDIAKGVINVKPSQIFAAGLLTMNQNEQLNLGNKNSVLRRLRYEKKKNYPKEPSTILELVIPEEFKTTGEVDAQPFLIYDSGNNENSRSIVFASQHQLRVLSMSERFV